LGATDNPPRRIVRAPYIKWILLCAECLFIFGEQLLKILGLNPKDFYAGWPVQSDFGRELYRTPALTFPVLKRLLPKGHEMRFFEGFFEPAPMKKYLDLIRWADVTGFNIACAYGAISYAVAIKQIKRVNPKAFIMAGGHHANMFRERWLDLGVDLIVKGEAELIFTRLVEEIAGKREFDRIPGVIFKQDNEYVETEDSPQIETLDESPIPDWDLINYENFPYRYDKKGGYVGSLECSRGCKFHCKFCAVPPFWKGTQRYKSIGRVVEEVKQLTSRNIRMINILDDGFGNDVDYTEELADAFRRLQEDFFWLSFLRVDTVMRRPDLIDRLAEAGMRTTLVGFESVKNEVLKGCMDKGMRVSATLSDYQELYQRFKRNNIMVIGVFISGHPDIEEDQDTLYSDARTICDDPRLADYEPYPRTLGYDDLARKYDIKDMFFHDVKLPVFAGQKINSFKFNLLNIIDLPRSLRMLTGPPQYSSYLLRGYEMLFRKFLRINRRKLRDYFLMRRKGLTSNRKQEQLMRWYLEDPEYQQWLDGLTEKVWF